MTAPLPERHAGAVRTLLAAGRVAQAVELLRALQWPDAEIARTLTAARPEMLGLVGLVSALATRPADDARATALLLAWDADCVERVLLLRTVAFPEETWVSEVLAMARACVRNEAPLAAVRDLVARRPRGDSNDETPARAVAIAAWYLDTPWSSGAANWSAIAVRRDRGEEAQAAEIAWQRERFAHYLTLLLSGDPL